MTEGAEEVAEAEDVVSSPLVVAGVEEEFSEESGTGFPIRSGMTDEEEEVEEDVSESARLWESADKAGLEEVEAGFPIRSGMTEGSEEEFGEESVEVAVEVASVKDSP